MIQNYLNKIHQPKIYDPNPINPLVYTHVHPHRENKASVSRKTNTEKVYIHPPTEEPLIFCRPPTSINPIIQQHKTTKSSESRKTATAKFFRAEHEKENELEKLHALKERINLVPTWEAREFVGSEINTGTKPINQTDNRIKINENLKSIDSNSSVQEKELTAFEQAEVEREKQKIKKRTKRIQDHQFQVRTERRINSRVKIDSLISNSLSADITTAQEHIYLQFLKTITRENDQENRSTKQGASSLYLRPDAEISKKGKNKKTTVEKSVKKKKRGARAKLLKVGQDNPSIIELHDDVNLMSLEGDSDEESGGEEKAGYSVPPGSPNFLEKYEKKMEELENGKSSKKSGKFVGLKKVTKKYGALLDSTRLQSHYNKKNGEQVAYARKIFMDHERSTISAIRKIRQGSQLGRLVREKAEFTRDMQEANYIGELIEYQQSNDAARRPATTAPNVVGQNGGSSSKKSGGKKHRNNKSGNNIKTGKTLSRDNEVGVEVSGPSFSCTLDERENQNVLF